MPLKLLNASLVLIVLLCTSRVCLNWLTRSVLTVQYVIVLFCLSSLVSRIMAAKHIATPWYTVECASERIFENQSLFGWHKCE